MFRLIDQGVKPLPSLTPEFLEEAYAEERTLRTEAENKRKLEDRKVQAQAEAQRIAENRKIFDRLHPFLKVCPVDFADRFEITKDGVLQATPLGICSCGFALKIDLIPYIDQILSNYSKAVWYQRNHEHSHEDAAGNVISGGQKRESSIGVFLDLEALAYHVVDPDAPIRFGIGPSEAVKVERPF
jgi:hypothetical protein